MTTAGGLADLRPRIGASAPQAQASIAVPGSPPIPVHEVRVGMVVQMLRQGPGWTHVYVAEVTRVERDHSFHTRGPQGFWTPGQFAGERAWALTVAAFDTAHSDLAEA
ncbi:MAG: hypothetical protein WKF57_05940 [Nakamurella sp.]